MVIDCGVCKKDRCAGATKVKEIWVCDKCVDELYKLFKRSYYVKKVRSITNKVELLIDSQIKF